MNVSLSAEAITSHLDNSLPKNSLLTWMQKQFQNRQSCEAGSQWQSRVVPLARTLELFPYLFPLSPKLVPRAANTSLGHWKIFSTWHFIYVPSIYDPSLPFTANRAKPFCGSHVQTLTNFFPHWLGQAKNGYQLSVPVGCPVSNHLLSY